MADPSKQVTLILQAIRSGKRSPNELIPLLYGELHGMAERAMRRERPGHTLQATALVHEAYLRLIGSAERSFENRAHFFGAAAEAMRRVLIDNARRKQALKRGGDAQRVTFGDLAVQSEAPSLDVIALDRAMSELEEQDRRLAEVAKLRYFIGLSIEQTAEMLNVSAATVKRDWLYARAWLHERLSEPPESTA